MNFCRGHNTKRLGQLMTLFGILIGLIILFKCCSFPVYENIPEQYDRHDGFRIINNRYMKPDNEFKMYVEAWASRQPWKEYKIRYVDYEGMRRTYIGYAVVYYWLPT